MRRQAGFFDVDDRLKRLSDLGDPLEAFEAAVDFEAFRPELNAALAYSNGTQGGRPPFDPVMMGKILVIQTTNNLSDERAEFRINDRLSFMRFLGSRGALDSQIHQGQAARGWLDAARRCGDSGLRDPNHISLDRGFGFIRKWSRKWSATDAAAYEGRRLRDGLLDKTNTASSVWRTPLTDRPPPRSAWKGTASSAMSIGRGRRGAPDAGSDPARQQRQIENPFARRACFRRAEGSDGLVHPDHRDRESEDEDRTGEPRLQYQTPALPAAHRGGMRGFKHRKHRKHRGGRSRQTKSGAEANRNRSTTQYRRVNRSVHVIGARDRTAPTIIAPQQNNP